MLALQEADAGDGTIFRELVDAFYGRLPDGTFDPGGDRYFTITGVDQRFTSDIAFYLQQGRESWETFDHFWWNAGYSELPWGLYPVVPRGAYFGPFGVPGSSPTTLVVGTTYDPATPYRMAKQLVAQMGNARLLTMRGDGHTAYGGNSPCIDAAVDGIPRGSHPSRTWHGLPAGGAFRGPVRHGRALRRARRRGGCSTTSGSSCGPAWAWKPPISPAGEPAGPIASNSAKRLLRGAYAWETRPGGAKLARQYG